MRLLVIGHDGFPWKFLGRIDDGFLGKLRTEGVAGEMYSPNDPYWTTTGQGERDLFPLTWSACTSFFTGLSPHKHGIMGMRFKDGTLDGVKCDSLLWDVLNQNGLTVGMYRVPNTWPARPLAGWMVSGQVARRNANCYPPAIEGKFQFDEEPVFHIPDYNFHEKFGVSRDDFGKTARKSILAVMPMLEESFEFQRMMQERHLMEFLRLCNEHPVDVGIFYSIFFDKVAHCSWRVRSLMHNASQEVGWCTERLVSALNPKNVILFSDHGFSPIGEANGLKSYPPYQKMYDLREDSHELTVGFGGGRLLLGEHDHDGIFLGWGPTFREGKTLKGMHLFDLYPTILSMFGIPLPAGLDGKARQDALRVVDSMDEEDERKIRQILEGLGYV